MVKLFIYGSTGDLVKRKVLPALQELRTNAEIFALGRRDLNNEQYADLVCNESGCNPDFRDAISYHKIDFDAGIICKDCVELMSKKDTNYFYMSLPPQIVGRVLNELVYLRDMGYKLKILIEKPFGDSLENAKELKSMIEEKNMQGEIFLSDHYLFKDSLINFSKEDFSYDFARFEMVSIEKLGLENRKEYYEKIGALKDMIQSHFLNVLFKFIPENEINIEDIDILDFKRAQYKEYSDELQKDSETETYVDLKLMINGKEIRFITGKGFNEKISFIRLDSQELNLADENPYVALFNNFFRENKSKFPTIDQAIKSWQIIEKIETSDKVGDLIYYEKGEDYKKLRDFRF